LNYICTWLCADKIGEESKYAQTGELSSSQKHQNIYWRCVVVFFTISKYYNPNVKHILFTNVDGLPILDGIDLEEFLRAKDVQVIKTDFKYKTPKGYYWAWQNQFYEFSILEYISKNYDDEHNFMILDSDCIFTASADILFEKQQQNNGFLSYTIDYKPKEVVNGISRNDMKVIYEELLDQKNIDLPEYHAGEFFLSNVQNIKKIFNDFESLWPLLLQRNHTGDLKFSEEAHTLSYLYYKNELKGAGANFAIRRIWTNPVFLRSVSIKDQELVIWHLPAEKTLGIKKLYLILKDKMDFSIAIQPEDFSKFLIQHFGIPKLTASQRIQYYMDTYVNAIKKKMGKKVKPKKASL